MATTNGFIAGASPRKTSKREIHEWEVEDALRTLTRAKEIEKDEAMMAKIRVMAKGKLAAIQAVAKK